MEDFQGKYNGKQIDQLLDKANDIDLTKYALKTDNALPPRNYRRLGP